MKPIFEKIAYPLDASIKGAVINSDILSSPLHFHPEIELVSISKSFGKRFVGSSITEFGKGDLVLIGSNVPHFWKNDDYFYQNKNQGACQGLLIQFLPDIFSPSLLSKSEFRNITDILEKAQHGIQIIGESGKEIERLMTNIIQNEGIKKLIHLFEILDMIGKRKDFILINTYQNRSDTLKLNRIRFQKLSDFITTNLSENITLVDAARVANMNKSAFCRYFKKETGQTFINFLTELRITAAKNLLSDNTFSISQICFEVGFNNLSNFNRQFKRHTGKSPSDYLRHFIT